MKNQEGVEESMFFYNKKRKVLEGVMIISLWLLVVLFVVVYFLYLKDSDFWLVGVFESVIRKIYGQIYSSTLLGAFLAALFGGLVFVVVPTELIFIRFLSSSNNPFLLMLVYVFGLFLSYNVDYFIGRKLKGVGKRIVGVKKFYSIKGQVNKWGALAVFVFNFLPLPSQALTTILGVFNYPRARMFLFFFLGQFLKYFAIILVYKYVVFV